ncbi:MAG: hypothetical protein Phog2KO_42550 [Phototrophicaceae bacterium]
MARIINLYRKMKNEGSLPIDVFVVAWRSHNSSKARAVVKILFELDNDSLLEVINHGQNIVFSRFKILVEQGKKPTEVFRVGLASGLDRFDSMLLLAYLYDIGLDETKKIAHSEVHLSHQEIKEMINEVT